VADLREQLQGGLADRYRLERELGRGGMATVFLAQDVRHKRSVALKVLRPELALTLGPSRFQREIETVARLQHPHILAIHDSGDAAGHLWFTMPFVEGESLRDRLRRDGQLSVEEAVRITREAAQALQYAHEHGVIHRDIKPENLLLTPDGNTLVADFGIARGEADEDARLTSTGAVLGTPAYMSPEQGAGDRKVDARSDIYSLGCVLYEMLAGEPPFTAPTVQALIVKRLSAPAPDVSQARPSVPEHVGQAVSKALAPVAADRFPSAAEFAGALQVGPTGPGPRPRVPDAPAASAKGGRRLPVAATALGLGLVIGLGVLFVWRRSHAGGGDPADAKILAVLPFENLGDSADAYFADGMTDEVRGKLATLPGLQVIARASSNQYRGAGKPPQQIARELGVRYLLTATVRWEKRAAPNVTPGDASGAVDRVRVSPELVHVAGGAPVTQWQEPFDAALTDVFQVQTEIAGRVVQALGVALGSDERQQLAENPTRSLPAYDAYLKGEEFWNSAGVRTLLKAVPHFERAVARDPTFVRAWTRLAQTEAILIRNIPAEALRGGVTPDRARRAAERAHALAPDAADGHLALGYYLGLVERDDAGALARFALGLRAAPNSVDLLMGAALAEHALGRWNEAMAHLQQAVALDPRTPQPVWLLGHTLLWLRRYAEAREALGHAQTLMPTNGRILRERAMVEVARGDLAAARAVVRRTAPGILADALAAAFVEVDEDLGWLLDGPQQQHVLRLGPDAFEGDRLGWGIALASMHALRGDGLRTRAYADSARMAADSALRVAPRDEVVHSRLGVALAYLGRRAEAAREGERAVALVSREEAAYLQHRLARIYLLLGQPEKALDQLEPLLKIPYYLSPGWLKIDPTFDPLQGNPRFQRLVEGKT
jgi:eukaryotic-like serine/threonine-protein kinase